MRARWRLLIAVVMLSAGVGIAWIDSRPTWDDTGVTAMMVMAAAAIGTLAGLPPWLASVCAVGPILLAELSGGLGVLIAVPFALAGACAGFFLRRRTPASGPPHSPAP